MSANSKIEWTDHTFNPWEGCQKVGPGCDHCYAETRNARFGGGVAVNWGPGAPRRRTSVSNWNLPKRWNAQADAFFAEHGRRQRVFCASLADVFDNAVDPAWRADLLGLIRATPNLDWLLLTKRIGNAETMLEAAIGGGWRASDWPNVWIGATVVDQAEADRDIPKLLAVPARVRFLSMEPLLGPVNLTCIDLDGYSEIFPLSGTTQCENEDGTAAPDLPAISWVIVGGESGPGARPMHPDWVRGLRDQCAAADVPFLFKQWGSWSLHEVDAHGDVEPGMPMDFKGLTHWDRGAWEEPAGDTPAGLIFKAGAVLAMPANKKAAGRLLDGRTYDGFPEAAHA